VDQRHELGRRGEELAAGHLKSLGYLLVARNHVNAVGELDLVVMDGDTVVVVEVKSRRRPGRPPAEAVNFRKQRKLTMTAALFLKSRRWENRPTRFDVVEVVSPPGAAPLINHIPNAFEAVTY
jgi:putative endonuclease